MTVPSEAVRATWLMDPKTARRRRCSRRQPVDAYVHEAMLDVTGKVFVICKGDAGHLARWVSAFSVEGLGQGSAERPTTPSKEGIEP